MQIFNWGLGSSLLVSQEWLFDPFNLVREPRPLRVTAPMGARAGGSSA